MKIFSGILIAILLAAPALADLRLEIVDSGGRASTLTSNGSMTRIDSEAMEGFAIVDYSEGRLLIVEPGRGEVLSMMIGAGGVVVGGDRLDVSLVPRGDGGPVAGYQTRKYEFVVNGEGCGTIHASSELMQVQALRAMLDALRGMQQISRGMSAGSTVILSACDRAKLQLAEVVDSIGAPLLVLDAGGARLSEVLAVDVDALVDPADYQIPPGMDVIDMQQKTGQVMERMQNQPNVNRLMQQLQQSGGRMTPEMMQQMQQMQKMLEQQQQ